MKLSNSTLLRNIDNEEETLQDDICTNKDDIHLRYEAYQLMLSAMASLLLPPIYYRQKSAVWDGNIRNGKEEHSVVFDISADGKTILVKQWTEYLTAIGYGKYLTMSCNTRLVKYFLVENISGYKVVELNKGVVDRLCIKHQLTLGLIIEKIKLKMDKSALTNNESNHA